MLSKNMSPVRQNEISVTIIRNNVVNTELLLRSLQFSIPSSKIRVVGMLGARICFLENDIKTPERILNCFRAVNVDDTTDKLVFCRRKEGVAEISMCCKMRELESLLR